MPRPIVGTIVNHGGSTCIRLEPAHVERLENHGITLGDVVRIHEVERVA